MLYQAYPIGSEIFSSHLKYGCQIWDQATNTYVNKIFTLQITAIRIITCLEFPAHSSPLFKKHQILKIRDHVTLENCLLMTF